jgi:hypothetical protein
MLAPKGGVAQDVLHRGMILIHDPAQDVHSSFNEFDCLKACNLPHSKIKCRQTRNLSCMLQEKLYVR